MRDARIGNKKSLLAFLLHQAVIKAREGNNAIQGIVVALRENDRPAKEMYASNEPTSATEKYTVCKVRSKDICAEHGMMPPALVAADLPMRVRTLSVQKGLAAKGQIKSILAVLIYDTSVGLIILGGYFGCFQ